MDQRILNLEASVLKLQKDLQKVSQTLVTTIIFTNLLMKKAEFSDVEIKTAITEAAIQYSESEQLQSSNARTTNNSDGIGKPDISGAKSSGDASSRPAESSKETAAPTESTNGDLLVGDLTGSSTGTIGTKTEEAKN